MTEAAALTAAARERERELDEVLVRYLAEPGHGIDMEALKKPVPDGPVDLDPADLEPLPRPEWEHYAPKQPTGLGKVVGSGQYARDRKNAAEIFTLAADRHSVQETERQQRVRKARHLQAELTAQAHEQHANIDRYLKALRDRDRRAVKRYFEQVIEQVTDPPGFPAKHRVGYVPEYRLLVVEWDLPGMDVVPSNRSYSYDQAHGSIEVTERTDAERRTLYQHLLAQLALRAVHLVFAGDRYEVVDTVVVNGVIETAHPTTGRNIRPCLITVRSTYDQLTAVALDQYDPLACAVRYFGAELSGRPENLQEVTPAFSFDLTDPRNARRVTMSSSSDGWSRRSTA